MSHTDRYKGGRRETKKVYDTYFKKIHDDVDAASRVGRHIELRVVN